ncbi:MAG TPA: cupin domain-containing protein [Rhodocyclaceae bacterium]
MTAQRIFTARDFIQLSDADPIRSVVTQSPDAVVVMWHVLPGQRIPPHVHPAGQDTWTILAGSGDYIVDAAGASRPLSAGQVAIAQVGQVHGVINNGSEPLQFISVVAPAEAGYQLVD